MGSEGPAGRIVGSVAIGALVLTTAMLLLGVVTVVAGTLQPSIATPWLRVKDSGTVGHI